MIKKFLKDEWLLWLAVILFAQCKNSSSSPAEKDEDVTIRTPVTVSHVTHQPVSEYIDLPATTSYLLKNIIKANANGYLRSATRKLGQFVTRGETLFTLKTKEAENLGNAITVLDSSFRFTGINQIKATQTGILSEI